MKFSIKNFFSNCDQIRNPDLVTFTEEILNGKLYFLCSNLFTPFIKIPLLFLPIVQEISCEITSSSDNAAKLKFLMSEEATFLMSQKLNFLMSQILSVLMLQKVAKAELFNVANSQCSNVTKSCVFKCLLRIVKSQYGILICCILNLLDLK